MDQFLTWWKISLDKIDGLLRAGLAHFYFVTVHRLTTRKYSSIAKVSRATAFREITNLVDKKVILQNSSKGRSTSYDLNWGVLEIDHFTEKWLRKQKLKYFLF